jgi:hypothetical protein
MRYLLRLLLISTPALSFSQSLQDEYMIISSSLNLRENPDINSKSLTQISNGELVQTVDNQETTRSDRVNDLQGIWIKVRYRQFTGYAFSAYLGARYMLYFEHEHIHYLPKVKYWYGVYYDTLKRQEVIREIKTRLKETYDPDFQTKEAILLTDQKKQSSFLIATNEKLSEQSMGVFFSRKPQKGYAPPMLPGTEEWLFHRLNSNTVASETYHLFATGAYSMTEHGLRLDDYEIYVADNTPPDSRFTLIQNISRYLVGESHELFYCGDIDGDDKPDIIMTSCSNSFCSYTLFLSSLAKPGELLHPVSSYTFWDEC